MGAKQERAKGNKLRAEYGNLETDMRDQVKKKGEKRESESGHEHWMNSCEVNPRREGQEETES